MNQRFHPLAALWVLSGVFFFASAGLGAEVQIAGIRLNEPVTNLITRSGWGLPEGIGPLAQTSSSTPRTAQSGGAQPRLRGPMAEGIFGLGRGEAAQIGSQIGSVASPTTTRTQQPASPSSPESSELRGSGGLQYWLYTKSNGLRVIVGVEPSGNIATITIQGPPNNQVRTSRGIGLGSSYFDLINFYGYPEVSQPISTGLRVNYSDQDVVFLLQNLQVTEITIGKPPALATPTRTGPQPSTSPRDTSVQSGPPRDIYQRRTGPMSGSIPAGR